ncbi:hypothetical protein M1146_07525, partial [Patescibacteria group bacterium]|nr:hypothetical protein [Patescibacteria group bacterium]
DNWGFSTIKEIDNLYFTKITLDNLPKGRLLIFSSKGDNMKNITVKNVILNLDGSEAFYVYEYENK